MKTCGSCKAPIVWVATVTGKRMPVDALDKQGAPVTAVTFDAKVHTSHFATCPQAAQHRKARAAR